MGLQGYRSDLSAGARRAGGTYAHRSAARKGPLSILNHMRADGRGAHPLPRHPSDLGLHARHRARRASLAPHAFDLGSHARPRTQRASLTQHHPDLASRVCHHLRLSAREGTLLTLDSHGPLFGAILGHRSATRKGTLRSYDFSARKGLATLLRDLVSIPLL